MNTPRWTKIASKIIVGLIASIVMTLLFAGLMFAIKLLAKVVMA
jgi:hypothetical protein